MGRELAFKKSHREAVQNAKKLRRVQDKLWNNAAHAPIFCKEAGKDKNGKQLYRSARLIGGHAYQIAASGAATAVVRELKGDCAAFGMEYEASTGMPSFPRISVGAKMALEQFMAAYVQEAVCNAKATMTYIGKHKRLTRSYLRTAFADANESIFNASGPAARAAVIVPLKKAVKKDGKKDDDEADYTAPDGADDEAADDAAVAATE